MAKYKILIIEGGLSMKTHEEEVEGEPVSFPGFEAFEFFIHKKAVHGQWAGMTEYSVSEVSSGCEIASSLFGQSYAESKAIALLYNSGTSGLQQRIDNVLTLKQLSNGN